MCKPCVGKESYSIYLEAKIHFIHSPFQMSSFELPFRNSLFVIHFTVKVSDR